MTIVEEWSKADVGVGADIAAINQLDHGNWALFVNKANKRKETK